MTLFRTAKICFLRSFCATRIDHLCFFSLLVRSKDCNFSLFRILAKSWVTNLTYIGIFILPADRFESSTFLLLCFLRICFLIRFRTACRFLFQTGNTVTANLKFIASVLHKDTVALIRSQPIENSFFVRRLELELDFNLVSQLPVDVEFSYL